MRCVYEEEGDLIETYVTRCRLFTLVLFWAKENDLDLAVETVQAKQL